MCYVRKSEIILRTKDTEMEGMEKRMNKFVLRQSLLLFLAATIWGVAFVAQSVGMDYVGPYTFIAARNVIGTIVLLPVIAIFSDKKKLDAVEANAGKKNLTIGGILCGIILFIASSFQQIGIQYTTVGKAGFITAMYIVLVPIFGIFLHRKAGLKVWIAVAIAVVGLYLLCMTRGDFSLQKGDIFVFFCAVTFSCHILAVDHFSPLVDGVKLSCIQFATCAVLSSIFMLVLEQPSWTQVMAAWLPILYAGALSSGVAYTLQIVGQKGLNPTIASLVMSMESVISLIAGWIILGQKLSNRELLGCIIVFCAIILVQLPDKRIEK